MTEREWREAIDMRPSKVGLAAVIVTALVLRVWGIGQGIPFALGVDEPEIIERVLRMMRTGDFHPHFFDYPTLYIYVQLIVACVGFVIRAAAGAVQPLYELRAADLYFWGRIFTALLGTLTVYVVYQIGLRWGARHALLAAALLAVMPNHVRESHYVLTDVPLTFLVALAFLQSLRAVEKGTPRAFAIAGVVAGLATATKYYGAVSLLLPLVGAYMSRGTDRTRGRCALAAVGAALAAFLVAAPYTVLDLPAFLSSFAALMGKNEPTEDAWAGWATSIKHLAIGFGWPGLVLAVAGFGLGVVRIFTGQGRARFALAVVLLAAFVPLIAGRETIWARYLLPAVPILCLLAAVAVVSGVSLLRRFSIARWARTTLIAGLTVAALLPPAITSVQWNRMNARESTQAIAYAWVMKNLPAGSGIAVETRGLLLPDHRFKTRNVITLALKPLDAYAAEGFDYLVASSAAFGPALDRPEEFPQQTAAYRRIFKEAEPVFSVRPSSDHPGPELRIFKIQR